MSATRAVELAYHLDDTAAAHAASAVSVADAGSYVSGTTVEAAIQEAFSSMDNPRWFRGYMAAAASVVVVGATAGAETGTGDYPTKSTVSATIRGFINKRRLTATSTTASLQFGFRNNTSAEEMYAAGTSSAASGFKFHARFGLPTIRSDCRYFVGVQSSTSAISGSVDISSLTNILGIGKDAGDANLQFMYCDGSGPASKTGLGSNFAVTAGTTYDLFLLVPKGGGSCSYKLVDLDSGNVATGSVSTDLPASNTALYWQLFGSNGPTGGTACALEYSHVFWQYPLVNYT